MEVFVVVLIVLVRGLVPFSVLRWPFWGGLACIAGDAFDTVIQDALGVHPLDDFYHHFDKAFDLYYLAFEAFVAWRWVDPLARYTAATLFALRMAGVVAHEITGSRGLLFIGPNIFENFYLFTAGMLTIDATYRYRSYWHLGAVVVFVGAPKVFQEYVMHFREAATWRFVRENILLWR